jgi:GNAT superfamily N-acetyltransferase
VRLMPAADLDPAGLAEVRGIYEDAFRAELRAPFESLLADQFLTPVAENSAEPCGLAVLRLLGPTGWIYLRYFAVGSRGRGLGSAAFSELLQAMTEAGHQRLIWDVEDPAESGAGEGEVHLRLRRIKFYTRLGGRLLPIRGYHTPDDAGPHPMRLMAAELGGSSRPIVGADLRELVLTVYRYRFELDDADPIVQHTLRESGFQLP